MLVISRRIGESFLIGENIEATIVDITGEKVVLGIQAPRELAITRTGGAESLDNGETKPGINTKSYGRQYKQKLSESE